MARLIKNEKGDKVIVEKGDTLTGISNQYPEYQLTPEQIAALNKLVDADKIFVDQELQMEKSDPKPTSPVRVTNVQMGPLSTDDKKLVATWDWSQEKNTSGYKIVWSYTLISGVTLHGSVTTISVDEDYPKASRITTFDIPAGAVSVSFRVMPVSKTKTGSNKKGTTYFEAEWATAKKYTVKTPLTVPGVPVVKIENYALTASLENLTTEATHVQFQIVKDNKTVLELTKEVAINKTSKYVSYRRNVEAGYEYTVRCRAVKDSLYSDWSDYSAAVKTVPAAVKEISSIVANSETSVQLSWSAAPAAKTYEIEYATNEDYFGKSDQTTTKTGIEGTSYIVTGLESGVQHFFRIRAVNETGSSTWSTVRSIVIGKPPAAPTTWSSTTTAITGEPLTLYWVHNSEDGSSQTYADLELYIGDERESHMITNSTDEELKDKTSSYVVDTSAYPEGTQIQWRVRTAGITKQYGDWSVQRTIDIYTPPTLEVRLTDLGNNDVDTVTAFPVYVYALAGPNTQQPIGYHVVVTTNEAYDIADDLGNVTAVSSNEQVYSKYFDISEPLLIELSAGNVNLKNNVKYTVTVTVSMNSGLTTEASKEFTVAWDTIEFTPNAEVSLDADTYTTYIRPYCEDRVPEYRKVEYASGIYTVTDEVLEYAYGDPVRGKRTTTGEVVYSGVAAGYEQAYFCEVDRVTPVEDVTLSVYRREFDGGFTELATNIDPALSTTIVDPHPSLDYARYRIVATSTITGAVSYFDMPGHPIGSDSVIIQWDEEWTSFNVTNDDLMEKPPWSGSLLKIPYNIEISDTYTPDVANVAYIGRKHPIVYYGTQKGHKSNWNVAIPKHDKDTLYALRRLAEWMGDVYVREPSGSGYWANISVSFSQKYLDLTIPVTLTVTRVEGGA